jgi:hypothetical protein
LLSANRDVLRRTRICPQGNRQPLIPADLFRTDPGARQLCLADQSNRENLHPASPPPSLHARADTPLARVFLGRKMPAPSKKIRYDRRSNGFRARIFQDLCETSIVRCDSDRKRASRAR